MKPIFLIKVGNELNFKHVPPRCGERCLLPPARFPIKCSHGQGFSPPCSLSNLKRLAQACAGSLTLENSHSLSCLWILLLKNTTNDSEQFVIHFHFTVEFLKIPHNWMRYFRSLKSKQWHQVVSFQNAASLTLLPLPSLPGSYSGLHTKTVCMCVMFTLAYV